MAERGTLKKHRRTFSDGHIIVDLNQSSRKQDSFDHRRRKSLGDLTEDSLRTPRTTNRQLSRKQSFFSSRGGDSPIAIHLLQFYKELWGFCNTSRTVQCKGFGCMGPGELSALAEEGRGGGGTFDILQALTEENSLPRLRHQLFIKEIRRINPSLCDGYLFVDGLYEVISSRLPWPSEKGGSEINSSPRELLTNHCSGALMLQKYWIRPDDPAEIGSYLTIASSFVQYIHSVYGSRGIARFLRNLQCDGHIPATEEFSFNGKDLLTLEFKWKRCVEAEVNEKFRLSSVGMLWLLFKCYLRHCWLRIFIMVTIICMDVALHLGFAILFGILLGLGFTSSSGVEGIGMWIGIVLGVIIMRFIIANLNVIVISSVAVKVSTKLRQQIAARIHKVSYKFLTDHSPSEILSIFTEDVSNIELFISISMGCVLWACLMLVVCVVYAIVIIWPVGLPLGFVFISMRLTIQWISTILAKHSFAKMQAVNKLLDIVKETIDGFQENRIYNRGPFWQKELNHTLKSQYVPKSRRSIILTQFVILFQLVGPNCIGALLVFGIILLSAYNWVEFEKGISVYIMYQLTVIAITSASAQFPQVHAARVGLGRINALLNNPNHDIRGASSLPFANISLSDSRRGIKGGLPVEFRNVSFCYSPLASHWNLFDVSFIVSPGERVAVVGRTGSGKSTLLNLLLQMYLPTSGEVLIGGVATTGQPDDSVATTFQTNHMFNMTIRENIRFGNLDATDDQVEEAAKMADIHDWIESLSRGYDTAVKSDGTSLSGGQKQRIAIARMLVADAPVLLLDEVTSALDPATESRVFKTLMNVTKGRTVVAVTHRLEQAQQFDRILVLSHGQLRESGHHDELLKKHGTYYQMARCELGITSPCRPTPIARRHSLNHIPKLSILELSPSPLTMLQQPRIALNNKHNGSARVATPLQTLTENEEGSSKSDSHTTIIFNSGTALKPTLSVTNTEGETELLETPLSDFPNLPSSTPYAWSIKNKK